MSANMLEQQTRDAAVRVDGKRWCHSCGCYHPASEMTPFKQASGGVIYRCKKWVEARARRLAEVACIH